MQPLLVTAAILYVLALLQALAGILFFRARTALAAFFFQSLFLMAAAVSATIFDFPMHLTLAWLLVGVFLLFFVHGFTYWRRARGT